MGLLSDVATGGVRKVDEFVTKTGNFAWGTEQAVKKGEDPSTFVDESGDLNRVPMEQSDEGWRMADETGSRTTRAGVLSGMGLGSLAANPAVGLAAVVALLVVANFLV